MAKYRVISGPHSPAFGLNTEIYGVNLRIQSEYRKIGPEITPHLDTFHAVRVSAVLILFDDNEKKTTIE